MTAPDGSEICLEIPITVGRSEIAANFGRRASRPLATEISIGEEGGPMRQA